MITIYSSPVVLSMFPTLVFLMLEETLSMCIYENTIYSMHWVRTCTSLLVQFLLKLIGILHVKIYWTCHLNFILNLF